jgi:hypothetical protein
MAFRMKTTTQKPLREVYTSKMWIKSEINKPVKPDELFLAFAISFVLVLMSVLWYNHHQKVEEQQRIEQMKQRIKDIRR